MNAGRAVALMLDARVTRAPRPARVEPLPTLSRSQASRLALALAAPTAPTADRSAATRRRAQGLPALEPTALG